MIKLCTHEGIYTVADGCTCCYLCNNWLTISLATFLPSLGLSNHTLQRTDWRLIPLWDANGQPQSQPALQLVISAGRTSPIWADSKKHTKSYTQRCRLSSCGARRGPRWACVWTFALKPSSVTARLLHGSVGLSDSQRSPDRLSNRRGFVRAWRSLMWVL